MSKQNAEKSLDVSGKTVEQAVEKGLDQLDLAEKDVNIEVLSEGKRGVFGLGAEDAMVRLTPKKQDNSPAEKYEPDQKPVSEIKAKPTDSAPPAPPKTEAKDTTEASQTDTNSTDADAPSPDLEEIATRHLSALLEYMGVDATITARIATDLVEPDETPPLVLNVEGQDLGILIGRRSETLRALQYVVRLMVSKELKSWQPVVIDVESYRVRRRQSLQRIAEKMAERAISSNKRVILESMPANERRIIHLTLKNNPAVITKSVGYDQNRKVTIIPK